MDDLDRLPGTLETDAVEVGTLTAEDLDWVTRIDRERTGRSRRDHLELKLRESLRDTGIRVSLAARVDGEPAGFLMARLYYGEFGVPEPVAILDTIAVSPASSGRKVGTALIQQLLQNLRAVGIETLQTQVDWNQWDLARFFEKAGFRPAPRLCLERRV